MRKRIGMPGVFAICTGAMFSSGFFLLPGLAADQVGPALPFAFLIAGVAVLPAVLCMAELSSAMPRAGGPYYFIARGLGAFAGTIGGIGGYLMLILKGAFAFVGVGAYLALVVDVPIRPVALILVAVFTAVNLYGVRQTIRIELVLVALLLAILGYFILAGGVELASSPQELSERMTPLLPFGVSGLLAGVALVFVSYGGVGQIGTVAEEVRDPGRTIPRGMLGSLATATLFYVLGSVVMLGLVAPEALRGDVAPVATAGRQLQILPLSVVVIVAAALAAFLSTGNAAILGAARYPVAMARDGLVWRRLAKLSEGGTPRIAVIVTGVLLAIVILLLDVTSIARFASVFLLFIFGLLCLVVIIMRESRLSEYQPSFRSPLYPWVQLGGIAVSLMLIVESGLDAVVSVLLVGGVAAGWWQVGLKDKSHTAGAFYGVLSRIARSAIADAPESVDLGLTRLHRETIDGLIDRAVVIELEEGADFDDAFRRAADVVAERVGVEREGLVERFTAEARRWASPLAGGIAIAPLLLEGIEQPEMVLVKSEDGVLRDRDTLHALVFVVDDERESARLVRILSQLAGTMQDETFVRAWRGADSPDQIKQSLQRDVRAITLELRSEGPSGKLLGQTVGEVDLPEDLLVALIRRGDDILIPRGPTSFEEGDFVTFIGHADAVDELALRYAPSN